jgi:hypothetical protein
LFAVVLLMSATSTTLIQSLEAKMAQVYGAYVWAYLVLVAVMMVLLKTPRAKDVSGTVHEPRMGRQIVAQCASAGVEASSVN